MDNAGVMDRNLDDRRVELKLRGIAVHLMDRMPKCGIVRSHKSDDRECWWKFQSDLAANETYDVAIGRLVESLGGEAAVHNLMERLSPSTGTVAIYVPFNSPYQESNGVSAAVVQLLGKLGLGIDVIPVDFDPQNPTHFASGYE